MKKSIFIIKFLIIFISLNLFPVEQIRIATWNIEHHGSSGRGLGGIGAGNLPQR